MKKVLIFLMFSIFCIGLQADGKDKQKNKNSKKRVIITMEYDDEGNLIYSDSTEIVINAKAHKLNHFLWCNEDDSVHKIITKSDVLERNIKKCIGGFMNVCTRFKDSHFGFPNFEKTFDEDFMKNFEKDMKKLGKKLEGMDEMLQKMDSLQFHIFENLKWIEEDEKKGKKKKKDKTS